MSRTLYLIDGHAQIFRAFFAIRSPMNSPVTGEPTNASFAFTAMLLKLFSVNKPTHAVMVIDAAGKKNFREELYPQYKAQRPPTPPDLIAQQERIFEITRLFGMPVLGRPGDEADDIIACLTQRVLSDPALSDVNIRIVTKDKDLEQLLSDRVTMFDIHTDTTIDAAWLLANKGITPGQVVDVLALTGDTVDNVPGVAGVGPKTAAQLVQEFGSVENVLKSLDKITGKKRENLEKAREILPLSKTLVTLKRELDLPPFSLDDAKLAPPDAAALTRVFTDLGFRRHVADLNKLVGIDTPPEAVAPKSAPPAASTTSPTPAPLAAPTPVKPRAKKAAPADDGAGGLFDQRSDDASQTTAYQNAAAESDATAARVLSDSAVTSGCDYRAVTTLDDLQRIERIIRQHPILAVDTETTALGHDGLLCGISLSWQPNAGVYIPVRSPDPSSHLTLNLVRQVLGPLLQDASIAKTGHNLKFDYQALQRSGITLNGIVFDTMIASYLLNLPGHGIDHLSLSLLGVTMVDIAALIGPHGNPTRTMEQVPLGMVVPYACADTDIALRLYHLLKPRLDDQQMTDLAARVEFPLVTALARMELAGIRVDRDELDHQKAGLAVRIEELREKVWQAAGTQFNLDSPKQLGDVLFNKLGLPTQKKTKSGHSTDIEVLEKLSELEGIDPQAQLVPTLLVEYRQLTKLVNTYLEALGQSVSPRDGRVRASFHQAGTSTGRLSSSNPNLQNIPIRTPVGRMIRKAFVAEPGHALICADYSQIELRILAHLSSDAALIDAFAKDLDIHTAVAAQVFDTPLDQVTKEQRSQAKVINFGIIYGVTPYGLARRIEGMTNEGARNLIASYHQRYPGISTFLRTCVEQALSQGFVSTMLGHRRWITEVTETNPNRRALGERLAINSVVQGSAADLIKLAMVNLDRRIEREALPMRMLLQIHDELVCEAPIAHAQAMSDVLKQEMESAMSLVVPLKVEVGVGADWYEAK